MYTDAYVYIIYLYEYWIVLQMIYNCILVEYLADISVFLLFYLHMRLLSDLCSTPTAEPVPEFFFFILHFYCGK